MGIYGDHIANARVDERTIFGTFVVLSRPWLDYWGDGVSCRPGFDQPCDKARIVAKMRVHPF